jgi:ABC-type antimicrobial peptide transport system ATPase subunit
MLLDDIQKSASKMTTQELRQRIEEIRRGRVQTVKQVEKKVKKTKATKKKQGVALAKKLNLTPQQILDLLYGNEKDTNK